MSTTQANPNEVKYFNVKADRVDITSMVLQTDIFQDIFMPTWSCQIAFSDTQNLLMNIPIKPGTEITIIAETDYPSNELKTFKFIVYKISDRIQIKQEHQGYMLHCVTKEFYTNQKKRVSQSFKASSADQIVGKICNQYGIGSVKESDSDANKYSLIVPNMSPFGAINWVSRFAISSSGGADFLFYQTDDGQFSYKSLDKMFTNRSGVKFKQVNPNKLGSDGNQIAENFLNIEYYEFLSQHDSLNNFAAGYYGSKTVWHDIYSKTFGVTTFNYGDDIPKDMEKKPFSGHYFESANDSHIVFQPVSYQGMGPGKRVPADNHEKWVGSRKTNVMKLEENRLVMTVPGAVSHYKLLGKQVDVELPSHQDIDEAEYLDKYMKGSYVVAAIRHTFTSEWYKVTMELGKKRLENPYE